MNKAILKSQDSNIPQFAKKTFEKYVCLVDFNLVSFITEDNFTFCKNKHFPLSLSYLTKSTRKVEKFSLPKQIKIIFPYIPKLVTGSQAGGGGCLYCCTSCSTLYRARIN